MSWSSSYTAMEVNCFSLNVCFYSWLTVYCPRLKLFNCNIFLLSALQLEPSLCNSYLVSHCLNSPLHSFLHLESNVRFLVSITLSVYIRNNSGLMINMEKQKVIRLHVRVASLMATDRP